MKDKACSTSGGFAAVTVAAVLFFSLNIGLWADQVDPPAMIESTGKFLSTVPPLTGAAAGATANGNASAYTEITWNGRTYLGRVAGIAQTRYTSAGLPTVINNSPPVVPFPTPTRGIQNGSGDTKPKLPSGSGLITTSTLLRPPYEPTNVISIGRGEWSSSATNAAALTASALVVRGWTGYSAGYANDPYLVAPGSYPLSLSLDSSLLLSTNPDDPASKAVLVSLGQATGLNGSQNASWSLSISLTGNNGPLVDFSSTGLNLSDSQESMAIQNALDTSVPNQITLKSIYQSGFSIFQNVTLSSNTDFQFDETLESDATSNVQDPNAPGPPGSVVPEPASLMLASVGIGFIGLWCLPAVFRPKLRGKCHG
ncbi:MAG: hypothetical protein JOZ62_06230 [Acidobacteriaceae bacterium]|nr:hypothetical protein [Acidobacteriaceae bacterium]